MQCLHPLKILNPALRKNFTFEFFKFLGERDIIGYPVDQSIYVPCGKCSACRKNRANSWKVRLYFEYRMNCKRAYFVTFTFNDENILDANLKIQRKVRLYLERYRKKYGVSLRHFFVTDLGKTTGRLHLHGIIFDPKFEVLDRDAPDMEQVPEMPWPYGFSYYGTVSVGSISYCVKYMLKPCEFDPDFVPKVLCSPGLGKCYADRPLNYYHERGLGDFAVDIDGKRCALPRYIQQKMFSDDWLKSIRAIKELEYDPRKRENRMFNGIEYKTPLLAQEARDRYFEESLIIKTSKKVYGSTSKGKIEDAEWLKF